MHNMSMFRPIEMDSLTYKKKCPLVAHVSQGEEG
jgi:hypothetical protein